MSVTIDEKVVEMRFDNKNFEKNVQTSMSTLDKLKSALNFNGVTKSLENINTVSKNMNFSGLNNAIETVQSKFSALQVMGITALANITNQAVNAGKRIASALTIDPIRTGFQEYETQINAVQTILANTESKGTTLQDVNKALAELNTYADKTIYNFTEMTRNIGTFTAAGVDLDTSVSAIKGIANLAAVSGSTSQQASVAMYQLSQALASGTVKLMDWNSVVNAGMGGQVFQDALKETARLHKINIDQMIKNEGSFRETLKNGWLTSTILTETLAKFTGDLSEEQLKSMGYTDEQVKKIMKLGETANEAATKVKTFTQLYDTLKEAAQSGWTKSWELIIGDFGEAKETLTKISDVMGKIIGDSADSRNNLLSKGLSSGWKQLLEKGIDDEQGFVDSIKKVAGENGKVLEKMIEDTGSTSKGISKALKEGVINTDTLKESVSQLADKMGKMSAKELEAAGYTKQNVDSIKKLDEGLKNGSISMDEFVKKMTRPSGRENLIESLWNTFNAVLSVIKPVKEAFREIFPAMSGEQLYKFTENLKKFTANLSLGSEQADKLKRAFKGFFSIIDIGKKALTAVIKPLFEFATGSKMASIGDGILDIAASIGDFFTELNKSTSVGNAFIFIANGISKALNFVGDIASSVFSKFDGIGGVLTKIGNGISWFAGIVKNVLGSAFTWIKENISGGDVFAGLTGAGIFVAFKKLSGLFDNISDFVDKIKNIFNFEKKIITKFSEVLNGLKDSLSAFSQGIKIASLVGIAVAVTLLSSSIRKLSDLKAIDIAKSLVAIEILMIELNGAFAKLCKTLIAYPAKDILKASISLMAMAKAVDILSDAMVKISRLSWNGIIKGLVGVGACISALSKSIKYISNSNITLRTSIAILALAKACGMLSDALIKFGSMKWNEIGKGLTAMGGALLEFTGALKVMSNFQGAGALTGSIGMLIASKSLDEISENLKKLGSMTWETIRKGLTAMGVALLELGGVVALAGKIGGISNIFSGTGILIAAQSLDEIAIALKDIGSLKWETIENGLKGMGHALLQIGGVTGALGYFVGFSSLFGAGAITLAVEALDEITDCLSNIGSLEWKTIENGLKGMGHALLQIGGVTGALGYFTKLSGLAGAGTIVLAAEALDEIADCLFNIGSLEWKTIENGLKGMGLALLELAGVSGGLGYLTGFSGLVGAGTITLAAQGLDEIADCLIKIGLLTWDQVVKGVYGMGLALLELAGVSGALGYLTGIAGLVGAGTITLAAQGLDEIADALIKFGSMSWDEIKNGLIAMGVALGEVGLGGILNTFSGLGALSISAIAEPLGTLADSVKKWGDIKFEDISSGLNSMTAAMGAIGVGGFLNTLSGLGSLSLAVIAEPLGILADSVKKWSNVTVPENLATQLSSLAGAILAFTFSGFGADAIAKSAPALVQMADSVMKWKDVTIPEGLNDKLTSLSNGIKAFSWAFLGGWSMSAIVGPLGELAGSVSKWKDITVPDGVENGLTKIANGVKQFGFAFVSGWSMSAIVEPLAKMADSVKKWSGITVPDSVKDGLTKIAEGVKEFTILGSAKLVAIADPISKLADSFKKFTNIQNTGASVVTIATNIQTSINKLPVDFVKINNAATVVNKLVDIIKKVNSTDVSGIGNFVSSVNKFNNIDVGEINVNTESLSSAVSSIKSVMEQINSIIQNSKINFTDSMKTALSGLVPTIETTNTNTTKKTDSMMKSINKTIGDHKKQIDLSFKTIMQSIVSIVDSYKEKVNSTFALVASAGVGGVKSNYESFVSAGQHLGNGLIIGINSKWQEVYNAAFALGQAAVQGEKDGQQSHSPSKATIQAGKWFGEGLIIGIDNMGKKVNSSARNMGENAVNGISNAISKVSSFINSDIDSEPTIRPILDLSNVESGVGYLSSILGNGTSIGVMSNLRAISSGIDSNNQNGVDSEVVLAINKLRKDISNMEKTIYNINGVTYDDGSNVADAVESLIRAARIERRR